MMMLQQSTHRMTIQYHPTIGFLYTPNLNARIPNESGGYYVRTNSTGFRSNKEFCRKRSERPRILFFGDSYTAGDGCSNHERFSDRLGQELDVDVFNYGMSGTGTDQQLLIYEQFAREVEADLIVLGITVENIERIQVRHRESIDRTSGKRVVVPKPYFTLDDGELRLNGVPVPIDRPDAESFRAEFIYGRDDDSQWAERLVRLYRGSPWLQHVRDSVQSRFVKPQGQFLRLIGFQPYKDYTSSTSSGWQLMRAIVKRFHANVSPIPLLVVPIPNYFFYLHKLKPLYQELFEGLAAPDKGLHVMDMTTRLSQMPWEVRKRLSFKRDTHFSPFGHEQVTRLLKDEILRRGFVSGCAKSKIPAQGQKRTPVKSRQFILGLSCFYHNSAAALIKDGVIVAAAEEERFSRIKNDRGFPYHAVNYCLEEGGIQQNELSAVVYYDNAPLTFERILHTLLAVAPQGEDAWLRAIPSWVRYKLHLPQVIRRRLCYDGLILHDNHHRSHAASAYYPSPFKRAEILTVDGVGEWATASIGLGTEKGIQIIKQMCFPNSLGLLYSAFTQFTGFKVNDGEYKMMGLAPYGEPKYVDTIFKHLVDLKEDGSLELNLKYYAFLSEPAMTNQAFAELFDGQPRNPESLITQREMDLARSIQFVTEEAMLRMTKYAHSLTGEKYLCMAGGVALNCVANGRLLREGPFDDIWIQPAAGDAGAALGGALDAYYNYFNHCHDGEMKERSRQGGSYLGPDFTDEEIQAFLNTHGYPYRRLSDGERDETIARLLEEGKVVGHFSGRMEFGPRALGARSILGDARNRDMQSTLNLKIKYRESFRPFAPTVLAEQVGDYFEFKGESPSMLFVAPVKEARRKPFQREAVNGDLLSVVRRERSDIPAVTHVDYSARIQTIKREDHPVYYNVVKTFEERTGCAVVVNTSFNVRGEPIVCTPYDAYRCFMRTDMDALILGNHFLLKGEQPGWAEMKGHMEGRAGSFQTDVDSAFLKRLRDIYANEFVPLASQDELRLDRIRTPFRNVSSTWSDCITSQSPKAIFTLPEVLDTATPNAELMAHAITEFWTPGAVTDALRPVLVSLLKVGQRFSPPDELKEQVSNSVYVMF
jgi:carbamoyltransferase